MKELLLAIILAFLLGHPLKGQDVSFDVDDITEFYCKGEIRSNWAETRRKKDHIDGTLFLQTEFDNGRVKQEFFKIRDSVYLYKELYENPDTSIQFKQQNWGVVCEGILRVTGELTGDTIISYDPDTYDEDLCILTTMRPNGEWKFYYPNGRTKAKGTYGNGLRDGEWEFYDIYRSLNKKVVYKSSAVKEEEIVNKVLLGSYDSIYKVIVNTWIINDPEFNGYKADPKFRDFRFMWKSEWSDGIGDFYRFKVDGTFDFLKTRTVEKEYIKTDGALQIIRKYERVEGSSGIWELKNENTLVLVNGKRIEIFDLQFVSSEKMRLELKRF